MLMAVTVINLYELDKTEFVLDTSVELKNHYCYYGNTKLTDHDYIKNVLICNDGQLYDTGRHTIYCYGEVSEGQFLTTCSIYGVAKSIVNKDFAFAYAASDIYSVTNNRRLGKVGLVDVVLL